MTGIFYKEVIDGQEMLQINKFGAQKPTCTGTGKHIFGFNFLMNSGF